MFSAGEQLGKYQILQKLGSGGMADVYLAADTTMQRQVALKVLPPEFARDQERVQRFEKEVVNSAALQHPGIVTVYDVGFDQGFYFYSMALLPGGDLKQIIEPGVAPKTVLEVLRQVAEALDYAHQQGFVHRDIKPDNIMCDAHGRFVLTDFGIAKAMQAGSGLTADGMSIGTPEYMSPEQARGLNVDGRSDIYSLGILCYELLCGSAPYAGPDTVSTILMHVNNPLPQLPAKFGKLQPLLDRMLAKSVEERFQSAGELAAAVQGILSGNGVENQVSASCTGTAPTAVPDAVGGTRVIPSVEAVDSPGGTRVVPALPPQKKSAVVWGVGGAVAAVAVVVVALLVFNRGSQKPASFGGNGSGGVTGIAVEARPPAVATTDDNKSGSLRLVSKQPTGESKHAKIKKLLATADNHFRKNQLTSGASGSALQGYKAVLALDPQNSAALKGIRRISDKYIGWAKGALEQGDFAKASRYAGLAEDVSGRSVRVKALQSEIETARKALTAPGRTFTDSLKNGATGPKMVIVPTGKFRMGDAVGEGYADELPVHTVTVSKPYAIGTHEVTFAQYDQFCRATGRARVDDYGYGRGKQPVIGVSWDDAVAYTKWLSKETGQVYRLPSEAEWEYAARAGTKGNFWWGNSINRGNPDCSDCPNTGGAGPSAVGRSGPNAYGLYDTSGNAHEWCLDTAYDNYQGAPSTTRPRTGTGATKIGRGGGWKHERRNVRVSFRMALPSYEKKDYVGFRVMREL